MQLSESVVHTHVKRSGTEEVVLPAGTTLKIETSPGGTEILNVEVPAGKEWSACLMVSVDETDV